MNVFELLIGKVMPPVTLAVLIFGLVYRLRKWTKAPAPKMTLHPGAPNAGSLWAKILGEVVFFSSFRKENRSLWVPVWIFHIALVLILFGHTRLLSAGPDALMGAIGMSEGAINAMSAWAGGLFGVAVMVVGFVLLNRRFNVERVREISSAEDYYAMMLILMIVITGNAMRFFTHYDISAVRVYFGSLVSFGPIHVPHDPLFLLHFFLVQILILYLPFGKFLHIPGIFFGKALVAKDY
jgi:[DsrC]-trisulfide reductase subunit M